MQNGNYTNLQVFPLSNFSYDKTSGTLAELTGVKIDTNQILHIRSERTGVIQSFQYDHVEAALNEYWDGEYAVMYNTDKNHKVKAVFVNLPRRS